MRIALPYALSAAKTAFSESLQKNLRYSWKKCWEMLKTYRFSY